MPTTPTRGSRRRHLVGAPIVAALALGAGVVLTACEPTPPLCFGQTPTIVGTPGNDVLTGSNGRDVIVGLGGDDAIQGLGGDDLICGGAGHDRLSGMDGEDTLDGEAGSDTLDGGGQSDDLHDSSTDPKDVNDFRGQVGDDLFEGGAGRDRADYSQSVGVEIIVDLAAGTATGLGTDRLQSIEAAIGGPGSDQLYGTGRADGLDGRGGVDLLVGRGGDDNLIGGAGSDWVDHQHAPAAVSVDLARRLATGGDGRDQLTSIENVQGSRFGDVLVGDAGPNAIEGYEGNDTCRGGGGNDTFSSCP